jgi:hypothetical protein
MKIASYCVLAFLLLLFALPRVDAAARERANAEMRRAAADFLASLTAEQRAQATFAFNDEERLNWHFIPRERRGLPFKEMTEAQRERARALLRAGVGQRGVVKVDAIISLETVLRELGGNPAVRDPELYFFSVFGTPSDSEPWGWRTEGHHLSVNFTIAGSSVAATSPAFFGANPAEIRTGARQGFRALAAEEDLARALVTSLDATQRATAVIATEAPRDIVTGNAVEVDPLNPVGIAVGSLRPDQRTMLLRVVDEYLARMADEIAAARRARLEQSDFDRVTFAWAGSIEKGQPHYYRIQGPTFLIEYDNVQNDANHIHSVWRDFDGDFGRDLLREHRSAVPHPY